jgi:hypothetical protein
MLERYRAAIDTFSPGVTRAMTVRFNLQGSGDLFDELQQSGYGQADLCLELLRLNLIPEVEVLIGKPIQRVPGFSHCVPLPVVPRVETPDDRRVVSVVRNPRLPTTPSFHRFQLFRPGVTIRSLLKRGVTRRDIREAARGDKTGPWVVFA